MNKNYVFLRSKAAFIVIGLVIGLFMGFKVANSQYRREQGKLLTSALAQSSGGPGGGPSSGPGGGPSSGHGGGAASGQATEEVKEIIERAKANPNDAEAQMTAASQFIQIERPNEAMPFLIQANKAKPNDPRINAGLGVAHFMLGDLEQATTMLKRSRELGATEPSITTLLVGAYIQTGKNLDEADRLLKEVESSGLDPVKLARIRADLNAARGAKSPGAGTKSTLDHGPDPTGGVK
jgi:tetratricopeptide (TPR) repeat protein